MGVYRDSQHLTEILTAVMERAQSTPAATGLREAGLIVAFVYKNPDVSIVMDGRSAAAEGRPINFRANDLSGEIDVTFELAADVGHQFWKGKLNVPMALARGQIKARGAVAKALKLLPLLPPLYKTYHEVLTERGEAHLLA